MCSPENLQWKWIGEPIQRYFAARSGVLSFWIQAMFGDSRGLPYGFTGQWAENGSVEQVIVSAAGEYHGDGDQLKGENDHTSLIAADLDHSSIPGLRPHRQTIIWIDEWLNVLIMCEIWLIVMAPKVCLWSTMATIILYATSSSSHETATTSGVLQVQSKCFLEILCCSNRILSLLNSYRFRTLYCSVNDFIDSRTPLEILGCNVCTLLHCFQYSRSHSHSRSSTFDMFILWCWQVGRGIFFSVNSSSVESQSTL